MSDSEEKEIPSVEKPVSEGEESDVDKSDKEEEDEKMESDVKDGNTKDLSKKELQKSDDEDEEQSTAQKKSLGRKKKLKPGEEYDDESDGEPRLGLLEQPVVIESGKREKKKVERLEISGNSTPKEKKKVEIAEGAGEKLGDLPRVEYQLQKTKAEDLKHLHRFLFNRPGTANEIKKNIRQFSGFGFEKDDKEYEKKMATLNRNTTAVIKVMLEVLDLERKGTKEDIVDRMMTFCLNPKGSGKAVPKPKKRKSTGDKKGEKRKRKKKESKPKKEKKEKKPKKKKEDEEDEVDDKSDESDEEEEKEKDDESEDEDNVEDSESEEEEAPKKKKARTAPPKKSSPKQEKKPSKKETTKKSKPQKKKVEPKSEESDLSENDSSDEEPLVKKKKNEPPTNDELKTLIKKILDKANLEELTMKSVIKQVHAKFPDFDLSDRKDFIKKTVRQLIT